MRRLMIMALSALLVLVVLGGAGYMLTAAPIASASSAASRGGPGERGPHAGGVVARVEGSTIVVTGRDGAERRIATTAETTFEVNGAAGSLSDIVAGLFVHAVGTLNDDGSLRATAVRASTEAPQRGPGERGPRTPPTTSSTSDQA